MKHTQHPFFDVTEEDKQAYKVFVKECIKVLDEKRQSEELEQNDVCFLFFFSLSFPSSS